MPRITRRQWFGLRPLETILILTSAAYILAASYLALWPISVVEAWGFATGIVCVWLVVREHLLNWPIGLANNVFFFALFFHSRLYADMGLQVVYFVLGVYGWWNWMNGGKGRTKVEITRTTRIEWIVILAAIPFCTWLLREILLVANGAAPFWDSFTTILCLAAQYLLCRKRVENWFFWIAADVIYVPLYLSRELPLTALLYALFLALCLIGVRAWTATLKTDKGPA